VVTRRKSGELTIYDQPYLSPTLNLSVLLPKSQTELQTPAIGPLVRTRKPRILG